jgi:hypothetical protein
MYRPFKLCINDALVTLVSATAPQLRAVKSLARRGGVTWRQINGASGSTFLMLTHEEQRDRFSVEVGWAKQSAFKDWDGVRWALAHKASEERDELRAAAQGTAQQLRDLTDPGMLSPADLDPSIGPTAIEVGDEGVPWSLVASRASTDGHVAQRLRAFVQSEIIDSLLAGEVPPFAPADPRHGLRDRFRLTAGLVSWEVWFEHVISQAPTAEDVDHIVSPALAVAKKQILTALLPWIHRMANDSKAF